MYVNLQMIVIHTLMAQFGVQYLARVHLDVQTRRIKQVTF